MSEFAVFLRGVNVGGIKVLAKDLQEVLTRAGFDQVRTLLASGNVVLRSEIDNIVEVHDRCDEALKNFYATAIPTLVFTAAEVHQLAGSFPLQVPENHHAYYTLCANEAVATELAQHAGQLSVAPAPVVFGRCLAWVCPKGSSTLDPVSKLMSKQAKKFLLTTRNHNTLVRVRKVLSTAQGTA